MSLFELLIEAKSRLPSGDEKFEFLFILHFDYRKWPSPVQSQLVLKEAQVFFSHWDSNIKKIFENESYHSKDQSVLNSKPEINRKVQCGIVMIVYGQLA